MGSSLRSNIGGQGYEAMVYYDVMKVLLIAYYLYF